MSSSAEIIAELRAHYTQLIQELREQHATREEQYEATLKQNLDDIDELQDETEKLKTQVRNLTAQLNTANAQFQQQKSAHDKTRAEQMKKLLAEEMNFMALNAMWSKWVETVLFGFEQSSTTLSRSGSVGSGSMALSELTAPSHVGSTASGGFDAMMNQNNCLSRRAGLLEGGLDAIKTDWYNNAVAAVQHQQQCEAEEKQQAALMAGDSSSIFSAPPPLPKEEDGGSSSPLSFTARDLPPDTAENSSSGHFPANKKNSVPGAGSSSRSGSLVSNRSSSTSPQRKFSTTNQRGGPSTATRRRATMLEEEIDELKSRLFILTQKQQKEAQLMALRRGDESSDDEEDSEEYEDEGSSPHNNQKNGGALPAHVKPVVPTVSSKDLRKQRELAKEQSKLLASRFDGDGGGSSRAGSSLNDNLSSDSDSDSDVTPSPVSPNASITYVPPGVTPPSEQTTMPVVVDITAGPLWEEHEEHLAEIHTSKNVLLDALESALTADTQLLAALQNNTRRKRSSTHVLQDIQRHVVKQQVAATLDQAASILCWVADVFSMWILHTAGAAAASAAAAEGEDGADLEEREDGAPSMERVVSQWTLHIANPLLEAIEAAKTDVDGDAAERNDTHSVSTKRSKCLHLTHRLLHHVHIALRLIQYDVIPNVVMRSPEMLGEVLSEVVVTDESGDATAEAARRNEAISMLGQFIQPPPTHCLVDEHTHDDDSLCGVSPTWQGVERTLSMCEQLMSSQNGGASSAPLSTQQQVPPPQAFSDFSEVSPRIEITSPQSAEAEMVSSSNNKEQKAMATAAKEWTDPAFVEGSTSTDLDKSPSPQLVIAPKSENQQSQPALNSSMAMEHDEVSPTTSTPPKITKKRLSLGSASHESIFSSMSSPQGNDAPMPDIVTTPPERDLQDAIVLLDNGSFGAPDACQLVYFEREGDSGTTIAPAAAGGVGAIDNDSGPDAKGSTRPPSSIDPAVAPESTLQPPLAEGDMTTLQNSVGAEEAKTSIPLSEKIKVAMLAAPGGPAATLIRRKSPSQEGSHAIPEAAEATSPAPRTDDDTHDDRTQRQPSSRTSSVPQRDVSNASTTGTSSPPRTKPSAVAPSEGPPVEASRHLQPAPQPSVPSSLLHTVSSNDLGSTYRMPDGREHVASSDESDSGDTAHLSIEERRRLREEKKRLQQEAEEKRLAVERFVTARATKNMKKLLQLKNADKKNSSGNEKTPSHERSDDGPDAATTAITAGSKASVLGANERDSEYLGSTMTGYGMTKSGWEELQERRREEYEIQMQAQMTAAAVGKKKQRRGCASPNLSRRAAGGQNKDDIVSSSAESDLSDAQAPAASDASRHSTTQEDTTTDGEWSSTFRDKGPQVAAATASQNPLLDAEDEEVDDLVDKRQSQASNNNVMHLPLPPGMDMNRMTFSDQTRKAIMSMRSGDDDYMFSEDGMMGMKTAPKVHHLRGGSTPHGSSGVGTWSAHASGGGGSGSGSPTTRGSPIAQQQPKRTRRATIAEGDAPQHPTKNDARAFREAAQAMKQQLQAQLKAQQHEQPSEPQLILSDDDEEEDVSFYARRRSKTTTTSGSNAHAQTQRALQNPPRGTVDVGASPRREEPEFSYEQKGSPLLFMKGKPVTQLEAGAAYQQDHHLRTDSGFGGGGTGSRSVSPFASPSPLHAGTGALPSRRRSNSTAMASEASMLSRLRRVSQGRQGVDMAESDEELYSSD